MNLKFVFAICTILLVLVACSRTEPNAEVTLESTATPTYSAGLEVWRRPLAGSKFNNAASCSSCHGPDPIDLAYVNISDSNIIRRATEDGISQADANKLVAMVKELRQTYSIKPVNEATFRPFQPGGAVLPGTTYAERDIAFGKQLETRLPTLLSSTPITSLAQAKKARDELLAINPRSLKIGISLPRWSEDNFHDRSGEQGTINDWVADVPRFANSAQWTTLQNQYLANPTPQNFWAMYTQVDELTQNFAGAGSVSLEYSLKKYRATLIGQHLMRAEVMQKSGKGNYLSQFLAGNPKNSSTLSRRFVPWAYLEHGSYRPLFDKRDATGASDINHPIDDLWDLGDNIRDMTDEGNFNQDQTLQQAGFPQFVRNSVDPTYNGFNIMQNTAANWFYISFLYDTSLFGAGNFAAQGHYFAKTLNSPLDAFDEQGNFFPDGSAYRIHGSFMHALRFAVQGFVPESGIPNDQGVYQQRTIDAPGMKDFWMPNEEERVTLSAGTPAAQKQLFGNLTSNAYRMILFLYEEALDSGRAFPYDFAPDVFTNRFFTMVGCMRLAMQTYQPSQVSSTAAQLESIRVKLVNLGATLPKPTQYECKAY